MIRLHNTLTRQTEPFVPLREGKASVYSCGPTVYWFAHIGNMRAFLFSDLLRRALEDDGFDVTLVMNVTDVGHLVGDGDEGEDKMLVAMRREGKTAYDIAAFYADAFFRDLARLNVKPAFVYPRATEHISEQIDMIAALEHNGFAYRTSDGLYFDTSRLPEYGRLSGQRAEEKMAGARVDMGEKRNATDFALWKFAPEGIEREMIWPSPWGEGFPGWHIECSAMSKKYLGLPFDIHTGGIDHIPVHHENEIAQTLGAHGVAEANVWMHSEFITVDGGKMSKSLGNVYTVDDLVARGYDPLAYRYLVLGAHYRSKLNFTWEALDAAQNALNHLRTILRYLPQPEPVEIAEKDRGDEWLTKHGHVHGDPPYIKQFTNAIHEDLGTPSALVSLWQLALDKDVEPIRKSRILLKMDEVLGLGFKDYVSKPINIPDEVQTLISEREDARARKDWAASDRLRDEMAALGFAVEDTPDGPRARPVRR